jgi:hypothetical protein
VTKAPRLTIGLPVYNGERYLAESVEALLGQSYEDALDAYQGVGLAHSWTAINDDAGTVTRAVPYTHATGAPDIPVDALVAGREGGLL